MREEIHSYEMAWSAEAGKQISEALWLSDSQYDNAECGYRGKWENSMTGRAVNESIDEGK